MEGARNILERVKSELVAKNIDSLNESQAFLTKKIDLGEEQNCFKRGIHVSNDK